MKPLIRVEKGSGNLRDGGFDGAVDGNVAGTYFHGIFHNFRFRRYFTNILREQRGLEPLDYDRDDFRDSRRFSLTDWLR